MDIELKEVLTEQYCAELIKQVCSNLKMSLSQLKEKYAKYPSVFLQSIDAGDNQMNLEIRLEDEEVTMTCSFNEKKHVNQFICFLTLTISFVIY